MGRILEWFNVAVAFVQQIKALLGVVSKPSEATEATPPSSTIPAPGGRFAFTRAATIDGDELTTLGDTTKRRYGFEPAVTHDELMVGDLLTFRVELLDGREPVQSWGWARAMCPRHDVVIAKVFESPGYQHAHGLRVGDVIHLPRAALVHLFRVTASGAGAT